MFGQGFKILAFLVILLFLYSCSVSTVQVAPDEINKTSSDQKLFIHMKDGSTHELHDVSLQNEKLTGYDSRKVKTEIDVSFIQSVAIKKTNAFYAYFYGCLYGGVAIVVAWLANGAATAPAPPPVEECCPFVYGYDGEKYVFEAEPYGGAICRALKRSEWCSLDHLKETNAQYKIAIANELAETEYTDELKLIVVDHSAGLRVVPDASGGIHTVSKPLPPRKARDKSAQDILSLISKNDGVFWESRMDGLRPDRPEDLKEELILEFPKPAQAQKVKFLVNAWTSLWGSRVAQDFLKLYGSKAGDWISEVNSLGAEYRWLLGWYAREGLYLLPVQVETKTGWKARGMIYGGGPFVAKDKCYVLDVSDVAGETLKIKLAPPAGFWRFDGMAVDYSEDAPVQIREVSASLAKDGTGRDVAPLLSAIDDQYLVMPRKGDLTEAVFPKPSETGNGRRSLILKVTGYYDVHLEASGEPNLEVIRRVHTEPGFTARFALEEYRKMREAQDAGTGKGNH